MKRFVDFHWKMTPDRRLIYLLGSSSYKKGLPVWENLLTVNVCAGRDATPTEAAELAGKLYGFLEELRHESKDIVGENETAVA